MIDIYEGHFCRRLPERDAATFDLSSETLKDTFYAVLGVIIHAATTSEPIQLIDVFEDTAIMVKKVSQIILISTHSSMNVVTLNQPVMMQLALNTSLHYLNNVNIMSKDVSIILLKYHSE